MAKQVKENIGELPRQMSADAGYFSSNVVEELTAAGVDVYMPPDKMRHAYKMPAAPGGGYQRVCRQRTGCGAS